MLRMPLPVTAFRSAYPDLAAADNSTVVHYHSDSDTAATILAVEHRWVLARGTVE
jgi:hypothetical protein